MWKNDYKKDMDSIQPREEFLQNLAKKMHQQEEEQQQQQIQKVAPITKKKMWRRVFTVAAACAILVIGGSLLWSQMGGSDSLKEENLTNLAGAETDSGWNNAEDSWCEKCTSEQEKFLTLVQIMEKDSTSVLRQGKEISQEEKSALTRRIKTGTYMKEDSELEKGEEYTVIMGTESVITILVEENEKLICSDVKGYLILGNERGK